MRFGKAVRALSHPVTGMPRGNWAQRMDASDLHALYATAKLVHSTRGSTGLLDSSHDVIQDQSE